MAAETVETLTATTPLRRSKRLRLGDSVFRWTTFSAAFFMFLLVVLTIQQLVSGSMPVLRQEGFRFFTSQDWDVEKGIFGALPFAWGTIASSVIALILGGSVGVAISAFLVALAPRVLLKPVSILVDLLAAIPSIIYGFWGVLVLVPWLHDKVFPDLVNTFGWTHILGEPGVVPPGPGLFTSGIVLAIMIIPTVAAVTREVLLVIPRTMRDGALALGANRTEALRSVELPYASGGILGALILGLGRALGETMAVTMVIGNSPGIHADLLKPGASLSSAIANQFGEAGGVQRSALIGLGLLLFAITLTLNCLARYLVYRVSKKSGVRS